MTSLILTKNIPHQHQQNERKDDINMKIQRSDRQNKETSNIEQTDMFSSIDHEIEESIRKRLKTTASNISETSDSYKGALISEIASRMNRPYESELRLFTLDQIFLWIRWQDLIVYQTDQWNELIDYISRSDIERRAYKEVIYSLKSLRSIKENIATTSGDQQEDKEQPEPPVKNNRLKVIDNDENIEDIKRIEDLYKKPLDKQ